MSKIERLEPVVHGRSRRVLQNCDPTFGQLTPAFTCQRNANILPHRCRDLDNLDDLHFGIQQEMLYARASPAVPGAQVYAFGNLSLFLGTLRRPACPEKADMVTPDVVANTLRSGRAS